MHDQRLPRVNEGVFIGMNASALEGSEELCRWIIKLAVENPQIIIAIDSMGVAGGIRTAALTYKLLDSQGEADELNEGAI